VIEPDIYGLNNETTERRRLLALYYFTKRYLFYSCGHVAYEIVRRTHQNASFSREKIQKNGGGGAAPSPDPTPVGKRRLARDPAAFLNHFKHWLVDTQQLHLIRRAHAPRLSREPKHQEAPPNGPSITFSSLEISVNNCVINFQWIFTQCRLQFVETSHARSTFSGIERFITPACEMWIVSVDCFFDTLVTCVSMPRPIRQYTLTQPSPFEIWLHKVLFW